MRTILLAIMVALLPASAAMAEPTGIAKSQKPATAERLLPTRRPAAANSCAAYGPGFVRLAGSDTCVKVGGGIGVEAGGSR